MLDIQDMSLLPDTRLGLVLVSALVPLCLTAIVPGLAVAAEYYVDDGGGASDNNPGSQGEPWAHCPGMAEWSGTATLQPGDVVYFDSGGTWEAAGGDVVLQVAGGVTYDGNSWGSGGRAVLRATGELDVSVVHIQDDDSVEPTVVRGFEVDAGGTVTTGIGVNWPRSSGDLTGATKLIEDNEVHDVSSASAQGEYEYGIVVSSGYGGGRSVAHLEVLDNVVHDISRGGINVYSANDDPTSHIEDVLVRGNEIYATGQDPDYGGSALPMKNHVIDVVFEYNHVHDAEHGFGIGISSDSEQFRGPENAVIRYNIIERSAMMGIVLNVKGDVSVDIVGNLIADNVYQGIRFMDVQDTVAVRILNNTLIHNVEPDWSHEILVWTGDADVSLLEVSNNIFIADAVTVPLQDDDGSITEHGHNLYYREGGGTLVSSAGTAYTDADLTQFEPTALSDDPRLQDIGAGPTGFAGTYGIDLRPDSDGWCIDVDSPALDAGQDLGSPHDGSINSVARPAGAGWDLGAYELSLGDDDAGDDDAGDDDAGDDDAGDDDAGGSDGDDDAGGDCSCSQAAPRTLDWGLGFAALACALAMVLARALRRREWRAR